MFGLGSSPGLQEYLEAASFYHFIETETLLTKKQAEQDLVECQTLFI